jgi:ubiquitin carboxyl-terminal hydrolase 14
MSTLDLAVTVFNSVSTYMVADIANGLVEKIEKRSESTNTTALYTKTAKFSRLPKYLAINFIRFQWKPQEKIKAKILKRVQYPFELDMVPYCTPDLQAKLAPAKEHLKKAADQKAEIAVFLSNYRSA